MRSRHDAAPTKYPSLVPQAINRQPSRNSDDNGSNLGGIHCALQPCEPPLSHEARLPSWRRDDRLSSAREGRGPVLLSAAAPLPSQREGAIVEANEELIAAANLATLEADLSQRDLQMWRMKASHQRAALVDAEGRRERLLDEIKQLEAKAEKLERKEAAATLSTSGLASSRGAAAQVEASRLVPTAAVQPTGVIPSSFQRVRPDDAAPLWPVSSSGAPDATNGLTICSEVEARYLSSKLITLIEDVETEVDVLSQKFDDILLQRSLLGDELERLRERVRDETRRRDELEKLKCTVAASRANPVQRQILETARQLAQLLSEVGQSQADMEQRRKESSSMTRHLLEGAREREKELGILVAELEKHLPPLFHLESRDANDGEADDGGIQMYSILQQTLREQKLTRTRYLHVASLHAEQCAALVDYITVLSHRLHLHAGGHTP